MAGDGKISLALGGAKKTKAAPTNGVKRSHAALNDGEDEEQLDGKAQTVSHFDIYAGGAIDEANKPKEEQPLVIKPQANRDWKEASQRNKRQKVPAEFQQNGRAEEIEALGAAKKPTFGLNVSKKEEVGEGGAMEMEEMQAAPDTNGEAAPPKQKTDDELAADALLGNRPVSALTIPAATATTEEDAFANDINAAPDMATLDEYARVPVEQFGAAMLRGMGWKEGEGIGSQRGKKLQEYVVPKRRPALLGIGAKEEAAVKDEMGAWGRPVRGKEAKIYNPVLLKDRRTGEMFTEEEAEKRRVDGERKKYEEEFEEKERKKSRRRDDSRGGDRRDKDRERDRSRDRRRDDSEDEYHRRKEEKRKRREREREESDEEYYRRKEKDKRRREKENGHRDSDRERSRRHDGSRERHRDRSRDRRRRD